MSAAMTFQDDALEEIDYSDIEAKYHVELQDGLENMIVVDRVPIIDKSKHDALVARVAKVFTRKGARVKPEDIFVPWDDTTGKSKGYIFVEFGTADEAAFALTAMQGYPFDSKHTFAVNLFSDIERFANMNEAYVEPQVQEYKSRGHLRSWLADPQGRDQYVTYRGDEVLVHWHGKKAQCEVAHSKPNEMKWTELFVSWSPLGTYFTTVHRQGVCLWGGSSFETQQRFAHPFVMLFDFSPCEQYLVTWSHVPIAIPEGAKQGPRYFSPDDEGNQIAVWEIASGNLLRTFPASQNGSEESDAKTQMHWPVMKWSPDDKYVARVSLGQHISVYELPGMGLQSKKSIKIEGVVDFDWRPIGDGARDSGERADKQGKTDEGAKKAKKPHENMIAYWMPEVMNQPARVTLMTFPGRDVVRQKNLFNVSECKLFWQDQGDFLCVKVDRHTKTKKTLFCNLEIFLVREKECPVEVIELKDAVLDFSWEPKGERFAIVSSSDPNLGNTGPGITIKTEVSFYQLHKGKGEFRLLRTLTSRTSNAIRWSPRGRFVVSATVGSPSKSELQFWDLDFNAEDFGRKEAQRDEWGGGIQHLGTADHFGVTDIEWDPSGRYLATTASSWKHLLENGYAIWDFRGQELEMHILDKFKQFLWRPRPPSLLSKDKQRLVRKNLRDYSRQFEEEDAAQESTVSAELIAHRRRLVDEWNAWRVRCKAEIAATQKKKGGQDRAAVSRGESKEEIEVWVEELIDELEEEVIE